MSMSGKERELLLLIADCVSRSKPLNFADCRERIAVLAREIFEEDRVRKYLESTKDFPDNHE